MKYDAIIFDNDGVLVEPTDPNVHREAVREAFAEFGVTNIDEGTVEQLVEITGDDRDQLSVTNVQRTCREHGIDPEAYWRRREVLAAKAQHEEIKAGRKRTYPDVRVLDTPSLDCPLGVISNNQDRTVSHVLEEYDLTEYFDAIYGRPPTLDGIERRKPNTYYVERLIDELGAQQPLLVGDSDVDVRTAKRIGMDSVFLRRDHRDEYQLTEAPDYEISELGELRNVVSP